jgi:3-hydroxyacyl-[acyl-carrier-protein] dehydratase
MILDKEAIMKILPHRDPILMVDKAEIITPGEKVRAWFYIRPDLDVFRGHFPGNPILPGIYTLESMGQAAGILLLSGERYQGKTPLFFGSDKVRLYKPFRPGDELESLITFMEENEAKARVTCKGEAYLNGDLAAVSTMILAMR